MMPSHIGAPIDAPLERSMTALQKALSPEQNTQLRSLGWFLLTSNLGHVWRIRTHSYVANLERLHSDGSVFYSMCVHIWAPGTRPGDFPLFDHVLAQALLLTIDERRAHEIAFMGRIDRNIAIRFDLPLYE